MKSQDSVKIQSNRARCYMVYAIAPEGFSARQANDAINALVADPELPLAIWHDHFLGGPGGSAIFYVENTDQQIALFNNEYLANWRVEYRPMVFSFSPSALDAQIGYTLSRYRDSDWEKLRVEDRPDYGGRNIQSEAETGIES